MGTESQGYVGFDNDCNGSTEDYAKAGREAIEHWEENNNDNNDLILSGIIFCKRIFSCVEPWEQKAKDMLDLTDCNGDVEDYTEAGTKRS